MTIPTTSPTTSSTVTSTLAAPARDDVPARSASARTVRRLALCTTAGAVVWSAGLLMWGSEPARALDMRQNLTALVFQLGVLALLHVQMHTRATGTGRLARGFLYVEHVLLLLAMGSSLVDAFHGASTPLGMALDPFWPLSMLGMLAIGIRIAVHGRWRGVARFWSLVAESWAVVTVPTFVVAPQMAQYVGGVHLLVGYATLGVLLALRPGLTGVAGARQAGAV